MTNTNTNHRSQIKIKSLFLLYVYHRSVNYNKKFFRKTRKLLVLYHGNEPFYPDLLLEDITDLLLEDITKLDIPDKN